MTLTTNRTEKSGKRLWCARIISVLVLTFANLAHALSPFDKAMQYIEQGKWIQAETLLQYQLEVLPEHHRARLELAMVSMQLQQYQQAKVNLEMLLTVQELPENVKFNIDVMLEQVASKLIPEHKVEPTEAYAEVDYSFEPESDWTVSLDFAGGYDSNVRFSFGDYFLEDDPYVDGTYIALSDGTVIFYAPDGNIYDQAGNLVDPDLFNIDLGPRKQDTGYVEAKLLIEHEHKFEGFDWHNKLLIQNSDNAEFSDFDKLLAKLQTRLTWQLSTNSEVSLNYEHRNLQRGGDKLLRSHAVGIGYNWLENQGTFGVYTQYMKRKFFDSETQRGNLVTMFRGFDNETFTLGAKWSRFYWNKRMLSQINIEYKNNRASDDLDYEGLSTKLAFIYRVTDKWSLAAYLSNFRQNYTYYRYIGRLTDNSLKFGTKLDYQFDIGKEIYLGLGKGFRDSDIYGDISSDKTDVKLGMKVTF